MERKEKSTLSLILIIIGLGLCGSCTGNFINPILQKLIDMYPEIPVTTVRSLSSLPGLISICVSIPVSYLWGNKVKLKTCMIAASALVCCGMLPFFFKEIPFGVLLFSRVCLGVAFGLNMMRNAAIKKVIGSDAAKVAAWIGYNNLVFNVSNIVSPTISGALGDKNVRYSFAMYAVGIVALIINTFVLEIPNDGKAEDENGNVIETKSGIDVNNFKIHPMTFVYTIIIMLCTVVSFTINTGMSTFVVSRGFGEAAVAGKISSCYSIGCFVGSLTTGWWHKHVPSRIYLALDMMFCAVGFGLVVAASSIVVAMAGAIILGIGFTYNYLMNIVWAGEVAYPQSRALSLTLTTIGVSLGAYLSSYWMAICNKLGSLFTFLATDAEKSYLASAVVYILFFIVLMIVDVRPKSIKEQTTKVKGECK